MTFIELEKKIKEPEISLDDIMLEDKPPAGKKVLEGFKDTLDQVVLKDELPGLVREEIVNFNGWNRLELKQGEELTKLPDEPRHYLFPEILQAVHNKIPAALVGPAGSGKSTCCEQVAKALNLPFYLQNSVQGSHELTGYMDAYGKYQTTTFRKCFESGGVILVDEVDTSDAGALKWLNTALAQGYAVFPDQPDVVQAHADFRILIAANTWGTGADRVYVGANQLDASTLDRFVFFNFDYDEKMEKMLCSNQDWAHRVQDLRKAARAENARMVISPRATFNGAKLLSLGWDPNKVEDRTVWKGTDKDLRERILEKLRELKPANQNNIYGSTSKFAPKRKKAA
jgi:cobaltochelatase CobS